MWCLRLLLLVVLLPWSSSVKREHTPAGTPLITEWFGEVSSAPADAVSSATPTSPLPPCRLIDETDELPATETPATPIQDVTRDKFRRGLHLSEGGTTAWTNGGTEELHHVEMDCMVQVEGETKVKRRLFSWYHPNDFCPTRKRMLERARTDARSDEKKKADNAKAQQRKYVESHPQSHPIPHLIIHHPPSSPPHFLRFSQGQVSHWLLRGEETGRPRKER